MSAGQISLIELLEQEIPPETLSEYRQIRIESPHPFAKAFGDLVQEGPLANLSDLPFADPESALAASRKSQLQNQIWDKVCALVISGVWECRGRMADELEMVPISGQALRRGSVNLDECSMSFAGALIEDLYFNRIALETSDERAIKFIAQYCRNNDPSIGRVDDIVLEIENILGLQMKPGHVRKLMKQAGVDPAWSKGGRRPAQKK